MRIDGIEKELIIINPYRTSKGIQLPQSVQKVNMSKLLKNTENLTKEGTDNRSDSIQKNYLSREELSKMIEELRHRFSLLDKYLKINIDEVLEIPISKIIDMKTEEVIRQIPPEWLVEILRRMEELKGIFYSEEV
jgi:flagellar protein FlaG